MNYAKGLRLLLVVPFFTLGSAGCALDAQSEENVRATEQALANGDAALVWASLPTGSYDASSTGSFNSAGGTNHVTWLSTGYYRVDLPGLGNVDGGNVQVTSHDIGGNFRCKQASRERVLGTLRIFIRCYASTTGQLINTGFMMSYARRTGTPGAETAYLRNTNPQSAEYTVTGPYRWNSTGQPITITHTPGSGLYTVSPQGQNLNGGTVEVTAYGSGSTYCKVGSWGGSSISVLCWDRFGNPAESQFEMVFSTKSPNNIPSYSYAWANQPSAPLGTWSSISATYAQGEIGCGCPGNVTVADASVYHSGTGQYVVRFPGLASIQRTPLNVKVTGYGWGSDTCTMNEFGQGTPDGYATVQCFSANGTPVDAFFTVTYSSFAFTIG